MAITADGLGYQAERGRQFDHSRLEGCVPRFDVVKLEVSVAHHVQQNKGVGGVDLIIGQVFRPRFCAEGVPRWLVLSVVEKQHHVMVKAHRRDVSSQFEQDRHPAGSVVGAWHGLRAIAFVFILVGHASRVVVGGKDQLTVPGLRRRPPGKEVGQFHAVALVGLRAHIVPEGFKVRGDGCSKLG